MSYSQENPYASTYMSTAALAAESERAGFIRRTYLHLAAAILGFVSLEVVIFSVVPAETLGSLVATMSRGRYSWLIVLGCFMAVSWIADWWARSDTSVGLQYLGLALYVVAEAVLFVPLLWIAAYAVDDPNLIPSAGILTTCVFAGLTAVVFITRKDFSFLRMFLSWGMLLAFGLLLCGVFFGLSLGIWFSVGLIALASGYILYYTSNILHHYRTDQHVAAALALFASVALLFWYILQLLMALGRD